MFNRKKTKKFIYQVECSEDASHVFEKIFEIEEGTENVTTEVQAFCPHCNDYVNVNVQGRMAPDQEIMKKFKHP